MTRSLRQIAVISIAVAIGLHIAWLTEDARIRWLSGPHAEDYE